MVARVLGVMLFAAAVAQDGPAPIVGGLPAVSDEFPTVVALTLVNGNSTGTCTGTLVTKDWVLTAAHCISPQDTGLTQAEITADTTVSIDTLDTRLGTQIHAIETIPDPQYSQMVFGTHDIGLVHLATPITDRERRAPLRGLPQ